MKKILLFATVALVGLLFSVTAPVLVYIQSDTFSDEAQKMYDARQYQKKLGVVQSNYYHTVFVQK